MSHLFNKPDGAKHALALPVLRLNAQMALLEARQELSEAAGLFCLEDLELYPNTMLLTSAAGGQHSPCIIVWLSETHGAASMWAGEHGPQLF